MSFDTLGPGGLDYRPCQYGESKLLFRGPKRALTPPFIAFVGSTSTYGKFVASPFVNLLEDQLGVACLNFGCPNAGVDIMYHDPFIAEATEGAAVTVVQIVSPRNMSNRFYSVHPRRNDRFLKPSRILQSVYEDEDFSQFNFTKHMLKRLHDTSEDRFQQVVEELQEAWVSRMRSMLERIGEKTVLMWLSDHAPSKMIKPHGRDPWFVTEAMIAEVAPYASEYVEIVVSQDALMQGTRGMVFSELEEPAAHQVLGPAAHEEVAAQLEPVLRRHTD